MKKTPQKAVIHFLAAFYLHPGLFIVSRLFLLRSFFCVSLPFRLSSPAQAFRLSGCFTSKTVLFFAYPRLDKDLKKIRCFFTHLILITILNLPPYLTKSQKKSAEPMPCRCIFLYLTALLSNDSSCTNRSSVEGAGDFNSSFWIWSRVTCMYNLSSTNVDSNVVDSASASVE